MLSRLTRVSLRAAPCHPLAPRHIPSRFMSLKAEPDPSGKETKKSLRTVFVRTWSPLRNMAEAWAVLAELERKFGKVLESHFLKDYEAPNRYQLLAIVVFADPKSYQRVPEEGIELAVPALTTSKLPHEISMEDLEHAASRSLPADGVELRPKDEANKSSVLGFKLTRAQKDYENVEFRQANRVYQLTPIPTMDRFYDWGGFNTLKPLNPTPFFVHDDLFHECNIDHVRMRAALQVCTHTKRYRAADGRTLRPDTLQAPIKDQVKPSPKNEALSAPGSSNTSANNQTNSTPTNVSPPDGSLQNSKSPSPAKTSAKSKQTALSSKATAADNSPASTTPDAAEQPTRTPEEEGAYQQQLAFARNLAKSMKLPPVPQTLTSERRKQPKPSIKPKKSIPVEAPEPKPSGALSQLWGLFGKR